MNQLKKKWNMLRRWGNILTGKSTAAVRQGRGKHYSTHQIRGYYNDLTGKIRPETLLDDRGIPLNQLSEQRFVYFPIAIFQYGLGMYDLLLERSPAADREVLRRIADWAVAHQRTDGAWDCFGPLDSQLYTVSAMGQGEGASFLFRAAELFSCISYREAAFRAVDFMLQTMEQGGTAISDGDTLFLEEYPEIPRRTVLNGWIFSIFGLYDAAMLRPEIYEIPLQKTIRTLKAHLPEYDAGYWSLYDISGRLASPAYHSLHIALLEVLEDLTGEEAFGACAMRYRGYAQRPYCRIRALLCKVWQKLTETSDVVVIR